VPLFSLEQERLLSELYQEYNSVIKPLIIQIESLYESFPLQIHNELRSFNDHVARCFLTDSAINIDDELIKAKGHIKRTIFDAFKVLNIYHHDNLIKFEKQTKNVDLLQVQDGEFYVKYNKLRKACVLLVREAKNFENISDSNNAFLKYDLAFQSYTELTNLIDDNIFVISQLKRKNKFFTALNMLGYFASFMLGLGLNFLFAFYEPMIQNSSFFKKILPDFRK